MLNFAERTLPTEGGRVVRILTHKKTVRTMKKYVCDVCGYEYDPAAGDPENGIAPGTAFDDLPSDWQCPVCGVGKEEFSEA